MLFSSNVFIWLFLPIVLSAYYIVHFIGPQNNVKMQVKNVLLTVFSLFFYAYGGISYLFIMISSICINYIAGILIGLQNEKRDKLVEKIQDINAEELIKDDNAPFDNNVEEVKEIDKKRKIILVITIILNIGILFYFKYFNMFVSIIENIITQDAQIKENLFLNILLQKRTYELNIKDVVLPIGISFFTFQALSYVIDVYRKVVLFQKSLINFALYVSFFPQLIAGPIVKYKDVKRYISYRYETIENFTYGIKRFCYGLAKKVILANTFAEVVDNIWALEISKLGSFLAIFTAVLYCLQLYYDFSGYSDMAIGLGKMFGFKFEENFNYPYMSLSITEFWRRWHISLSTWFKEYVYIPLGGNRNGKLRTYINLFIVFLTTGFWHGANFTFLVWGILHGVFLIIEKIFLLDLLKKNVLKFVNYIYTIVVVVLLFVIFRADNIIDGITFIQQMFCMESSYSIFSYLSMKIIVCTFCGIMCMGIVQKIFGGMYEKLKGNTIVVILDCVIQILLFVLSISMIASNSYNPFIYFRF